MDSFSVERLEDSSAGELLPDGDVGSFSKPVPAAAVVDAVEKMTDFLLVADAGGRVLYSNPAYRAWACQDDVRGQVLLDLALFPAEATKDREQAREAVWQHQNWMGSYWIPAPDGSPGRRYLATSITSLGGKEESCRGFTVASRDETLLGLARAVAARRTEREEFRRTASFLHHEMANPLTTITAVASLLALEDESSEHQDRCVSELGRGAVQLREVLELFRKTVRSDDLECEWVAVASILRRAKALVGDFAEENHVVLEFVEPSGGPSLLSAESAQAETADEEERADQEGGGESPSGRSSDHEIRVLGNLEALGQVLKTLVENSVEQAVSEGKGSITVTVVSESESVVIEVADSAGGVSMKALVNLFRAFYTTKGSGRGLGLTTARNLVTEMSGLIEANNNEVGGLTVTIRLPRTP